MATATEIESLVVRLSADVENLLKGMQQVKDSSASAAETAASNATKMENSFKQVGAAAAASLAAIGVKDFVKESLHEWEQSEMAVIRLEAALKANKREVEAISADYQQWAGDMQRVTTLSDEAALGLLKQAESFELTGSTAKSAAKDALALAAINDSSAQAMIRITAAMAKGDTERAMLFSRMVPQLRGVRDEQEFVAKYQALVTAGMEVQSKEAETLGGKLRILGNQWSDVKEELGKTASEGIKPVVDRTIGLVKLVQELPPTVKVATAVILALSAGFVLVATTGPMAARGIASVAASTKALAASMVTNPVNLFATAVVAAAVVVVAFKDDIVNTTEQIDRMNASFKSTEAHFGTTSRIIGDRHARFMSTLKDAGGPADQMKLLEAERDRIKKEIQANEDLLEKSKPNALERGVNVLGLAGPEGRAAAKDREGLIRETDAYRRSLEGVSSAIQDLTEKSGKNVGNNLAILGGLAVDTAMKFKTLHDQLSKDYFDKLNNEAQSLIESLKTPQEKLQDRMIRLDEMLLNGLINQEMYARGVKNIEEQILAAADAHEYLNLQVSNAAAQYGSAEARARILEGSGMSPALVGRVGGDGGGQLPDPSPRVMGVWDRIAKAVEQTAYGKGPEIKIDFVELEE